MLRLVIVLTGLVLSPGLTESAHAADPPVLEFIEPAEGTVFSTRDEIPIVLRAFAPNDVFLSAEIFANHHTSIGVATFCCSFCPCAMPPAGQETTLQIPVPWNGGPLPDRQWQGWRTRDARMYTLTARATGQNGTMLESAPVTITVVDLELRMFLQPDGSARFVIQQGSMVPGGYDLEASDDLYTWTRLGPFQPGAVAAFYSDPPPPTPLRRRFYRAIYLPPSNGP